MLWFDEKIYLIHWHNEKYLNDGKTGFNFFTSDFISTYYKLASQSQTSSKNSLIDSAHLKSLFKYNPSSKIYVQKPCENNAQQEVSQLTLDFVFQIVQIANNLDYFDGFYYS